uniref:Band 7 domain-containing protein n=1 Tax=Globisporangium ultimum (strain ATCC 200006 / CBS 805.95 / DAOM BR144) TaxID=431595 RepID=K3X8R9_GLOUD
MSSTLFNDQQRRPQDQHPLPHTQYVIYPPPRQAQSAQPQASQPQASSAPQGIQIRQGNQLDIEKHTNLLYQRARRVDAANRLFGANYDGNTVVIINPGRSLVKPYIRVPEGTYALVQHQGRDIDYVAPDGTKSAVWPPGYHWASLFTKVAHLVTQQYIVFDTPVKGCKTADDVTVGINICSVLRIMGDASKGEDPGLVRRFVYELGPNGLEVQLRAAQDEAVRALARSVQHTEVYQLRDGTMKERFQTGALNLRTNSEEIQYSKGVDEDGNTIPSARVLYCVTEDIRRNLNAQFNTYGVEIASVAITTVTLPDAFQDQMQSRTTHLSAIKEQNMKQRSDMQLLQYKEEIDTTKLKRKVMLMEEESTGFAKCAEIRKEIDLILADTRLVQEQIEQETRVRCNNIKVAADLKIAQIRAETQSIAAEIAAQGDADIAILDAEKQAMDVQLQATIREIKAAAEAKATETVARAEGVGAKQLEKYRAHELKMQQLDKLAALSRNSQTVIAGETSNSLLSEMLVANREQQILVNVDGAGQRR